MTRGAWGAWSKRMWTPEDNDHLKAGGLEGAIAIDARGARGAREAAEWHALSPQRRMVVLRMLMGMGRTEIASKLGLNPKTIDTHRGQAFKALGVANDVELMISALRAGVVVVIDVDAPAEQTELAARFRYHQQRCEVACEMLAEVAADHGHPTAIAVRRDGVAAAVDARAKADS